MPLLKCATPLEANYIMTEIHKGTCGNHAKGQSLVFKALRQGYYWPMMKINCMEYTCKCDKCQRFTPISKTHPEELTYMTSPWPFSIWEIDLIGRVHKGIGSVKYAVLAINYFTKWIEAKALASITPTKIKEFIYKNII